MKAPGMKEEKHITVENVDDLFKLGVWEEDSEVGSREILRILENFENMTHVYTSFCTA